MNGGGGASYDFRLGEGGLLRRLETAAHLTRLGWQILAVVSFTWIPLMLLGLFGGQTHQLLHNASMHVRLLIAVPLLLFLDHLFPPICRRALAQLAGQSFLCERDEGRFARLLAGAVRLADSSLPEVAFAGLAIALGIGVMTGLVPTFAFTRGSRLSAAQVWYALTDVPLFQFLLWRSLWRWAVWVRVLGGLSRLDLDLVATHPDRRGGIAFLRRPSVAYCATLLFVISSVLCADWGARFAPDVTLSSFKVLLLVFAIFATLIAFGPLLLFIPQLLRAARRGQIECDGVAAGYGRRFRRLSNPDHDADPRRDTNEVQRLAGVVEIYREAVDRFNLLLFDGRDLVVLLVATLMPIVPVMIAHIPREDWSQLAALLTGGRL